MSPLQTLRQARWITRLVLVWFALFLGCLLYTSDAADE